MAMENLRGRRVLVVEDESLILFMIQDILHDLGCELAGTAMRTEAALQILRDTAVDMALLDVNLGQGRDSYPVAEELAARGIPFAFLTGYGCGTLRDGFRGRLVLPKPVDQHRLEAALRELAAAVPAGRDPGTGTVRLR